MKMIFLWIIITFVIGFKVKQLNRWTVGLYVSLCALNIVYAYLSF